MLLEQVKSLNLRLSQSFSLSLLPWCSRRVQRVVSHPPQRSITEWEPPLLRSLRFTPRSLSPLLFRKCVMISLSVAPPPQHLLHFKRGITTRVLIQAPRFRRANIVLTLTRLKGYLPCMCAWRCTPINTWENRETNQTAVLKGCCADGRVGSRLFVFSFLR